MRAAVYVAMTFAVAVVLGLAWLEISIRRDLREMEDWWSERERTRGER